MPLLFSTMKKIVEDFVGMMLGKEDDEPVSTIAISVICAVLLFITVILAIVNQ